MNNRNINKYIKNYYGWTYILDSYDINTDYSEIIDWCENSNESSNWIIAAGIYIFIINNEQSYEKAFLLLNNSIKDGDEEALIYLGILYSTKYNFHNDNAYADTIFDKLLTTDNPLAYYAVYEYKNFKSDINNKKDIFYNIIKLLEKYAIDNNPKLQYFYGYLLSFNYETRQKAIEYFQRAALNNYEFAQLTLCKIYENFNEFLIYGRVINTQSSDYSRNFHSYNHGFFEKSDFTKYNIDFKKWFELSANNGNLQAQRWMVDYYITNDSLDSKELHYWLEKASNNGDVKSIYELGKLYTLFYKSYKDQLKGVKLIEKAAKLNYTNAILDLIRFYQNGIILYLNDSENVLKPNIDNFIKELETFANYDYNAMWCLGLIYFEGKYTTKNLKIAEELFDKAAADGNDTIKLMLAEKYSIGDLVNIQKAIHLYDQIKDTDLKIYIKLSHLFKQIGNNEKAKEYMDKGTALIDAATINSNSPLIKWDWGINYLEGIEVPKDINKGLQFLESAAHDYPAMYIQKLINIFYTDKYFPKNLDNTIKWLKKGIKLNISDLHYKLAEIYLFELNDHKLGVDFLNKGIRKNETNCLKLCGDLYRKGIIVQKDLNKAKIYYQYALNSKKPEILYEIGQIFLGQDIQDIDYGISLITEAATKRNAKAQYILGKIYYEGIFVNKDIKKAKYWLDEASYFGFEIDESFYEIINSEYNKYISKDILYLNERKDVFISWNHLDIELKNQIYKKLEMNNILTVWESDGDGNGLLNEAIEHAINHSKVYLIILTKNSIKSRWVEKEVQFMLDNVNKTNSHYRIIPLILDNDVTDILLNMNNSPFKELLKYSSQFTNNGCINYDNLLKVIKNAIEINLLNEYKDKILNKFNKFTGTISNNIELDNTNNILSTTLDFDNCYLNRDIYQNDKVSSVKELFNNRLSLIYGIGGMGKSLYLKNLLRSYFNENRFIFYLQCKNIALLNEDFFETLLNKGFNIYFPNDYQISTAGFERIFNIKNKIIILIDALDEVNEEEKKSILNKISDFKDKHDNTYYIFTSRNKLDYQLIENKLNDTVNIYELKGINIEDCKNLYDNIQSKCTSNLHFNKSYFDENKKINFFNKLNYMNDYIKTNPLLLSNMIFIYLITNELPKTEYEIINKAIDILTTQIDNEKDITFKYSEYLIDDNYKHLLGFFAYQRAIGNRSDVTIIFEKFIENKYKLGLESKSIAKEIYIFLKQRAIIFNNNISHEIYMEYFITDFLFNNVYELKDVGLFNMYYDYSRTGFETLINIMTNNLSKNSLPWPYVASNFITKVDFEIHKLNDLINMDSNNLNYKVFNDLLSNALKNRAYSNAAIDITKNLIDRDLLWYSNFIKQYI